MQLWMGLTVFGDRQPQSFCPQLQGQLLSPDGVKVVVLEKLARSGPAGARLYAVVDKIGQLTVSYSVQSAGMYTLQEETL